MIKINIFLSFLTGTSIYLSLGAVCLTCVSFLLLGANPNMYILIITFILTFSMYNLNRITDVKEDAINYPERTEIVDKYKKILIYFALILFVISAIISYFERVLSIIILTLILGPAYCMRWIPKKVSKTHRRLKDVLIVKNVTVALTWSIVTVVIVALNLNIFNLTVLILTLFVFFRLFINTVVFDMRDIEGDKKNNIKTVPVVFGISKTKMLLHYLNIILGLFILLFTFIGLFSPLGYLIFLSTFYTSLYIYLFGKHHIDKKFLCSIIADGEFIIIGLLGLIGSLILF